MMTLEYLSLKANLKRFTLIVIIATIAFYYGLTWALLALLGYGLTVFVINKKRKIY